MTALTNEHGEVKRELPAIDLTDPAVLEAWFGNFGTYEHLRKVVLANQRETERAKALLEDPPLKLSDDRADNRARTSDVYVQFLIDGLKGRTLRERNVLDSQAQR